MAGQRAASVRQHLPVIAVAVAFVALALPHGGYSLELRSALGVVLWAAVIGGIVTGALPRAPVPREALIAGCGLAAMVLFSGLSMAWGADDGAAFDEMVRVAGYLGLFVLVVCLSTPGNARGWLLGLGLGIGVVGALALGSRLVPALPGSDNEIVALLPAARGRLSYPIGDWNVLAALLGIGIVLMAWLGGEASSRAGRALAVGAIPYLGLAIYLTSSRGGLAVAVAGLVVLVGWVAPRTRILVGLALAAAGAGVLILVAHARGDLVDGLSTDAAESQGIEVLVATFVVVAAVAGTRYAFDRRLGRLQLSEGTARAALVVGAVLAAAALALAHPIQKIDDFKAPPSDSGEGSSGFVTSHFTSASGSGRYQFWSVAADAFADEPLHGIGAGGYEHYWAEHAPIPRAIRDAHSLYLQSLAELGPLGLAAVLVFLGAAAVAGISRRAGPPRSEVAACLAVVGAGAASAGIDVTWQVPAAFAPVVVAVGLLTGPALAARRVPALPAAEAGQGGRYGWGIAVLVVAWVALLASGDSFLAQRSLGESHGDAGAAEFEHAADRAQDAIALQPWAAEPRLQLALVHEGAGSLPLAREEIVAATDRAPEDWSVWLARARIETRAGDVAAATAAFERARSLNPRAPFFTQPPIAPTSP